MRGLLPLCQYSARFFALPRGFCFINNENNLHFWEGFAILKVTSSEREERI